MAKFAARTITINLDNINMLQGLTVNNLNFLWCILGQMNKTMCVNFDDFTTRLVCQEMGFKWESNLDTALKTLCNHDIIRRSDRGVYRFNPNLFVYGSASEMAFFREIYYACKTKGEIRK